MLVLASRTRHSWYHLVPLLGSEGQRWNPPCNTESPRTHTCLCHEHSWSSEVVKLDFFEKGHLFYGIDQTSYLFIRYLKAYHFRNYFCFHFELWLLLLTRLILFWSIFNAWILTSLSLFEFEGVQLKAGPFLHLAILLINFNNHFHHKMFGASSKVHLHIFEWSLSRWHPRIAPFSASWWSTFGREIGFVESNGYQWTLISFASPCHRVEWHL